ncbi:type IV pilin protein [uncultured Thiohalocapsa sp.]|uniref:type IV pilin protein n=1 Tax=uncultured Thiohalocapsa sp. TaxID=768990 RepID=UPI0025EB380F|nr:type IV pilin protein [uncultured Thiohalocapsa sp.]
MRAAAGVTLVELLVVVAIVGILAAVAYPSYQTQMTQSWRTQAIACLEEMAQGMERRFTGAMSYAGTAPPPNACALDGDPTWAVLDEDLARRYQFGFAADPDADSYTLQAVPINRQATADAACGTLSLDQAGRRGASGGAPVARCW